MLRTHNFSILQGEDIGTVSGRVFQSASQHPKNFAISFGLKKVTYEVLNFRALQVAAALREMSLSANSNIGILTQRTLSAYIGILGTLYAGYAYVPLNPKHPIHRLSGIARNAQISTVIFDESENFPIQELLQISPEVKNVLLPEKDLKSQVPLGHPVSVREDSLAYVIYTSGSTGEPKGVLVAHHNVCSHIDNMSSLYHFSPEDRLSQTFDLSFDPSVSDIFSAWFNGSTLCVLPSEEIYCASEFIQREKITFWASVPTLASFMIKLDQLKPNSFPLLKYSTFCGEPFQQNIANRWSQAAPNSSIENLYGPTEATVYVTRHSYFLEEHDRSYKNGIVPIGLPFPGQTVSIVDEDLNLIPKGGIGELCVSGSQATKGYLDDAEKTKKSFVSMPWENGPQNRWYKTGDLAFINEYGDIECLGRMDNQIKIAGQRMEIGEIEAILRDIAEISEVVVVPGVYIDGALQEVVAFIVKNLTYEDIISIQKSCKSVLPAAFIPKSIHSLKELPLNSSGKVDRLALKEIAQSTKSNVS